MKLTKSIRRYAGTLVSCLFVCCLMLQIAGCGGGSRTDSGSTTNSDINTGSDGGGGGSDGGSGGADGGNSDGDSGTPSDDEVFIDFRARTGPIIAARVDDMVTRDGSLSWTSSAEPLSFSWTFAYKPENSTAELRDNTTATPSFAADVKKASIPFS